MNTTPTIHLPFRQVSMLKNGRMRPREMGMSRRLCRILAKIHHLSRRMPACQATLLPDTPLDRARSFPTPRRATERPWTETVRILSPILLEARRPLLRIGYPLTTRCLPGRPLVWLRSFPIPRRAMTVPKAPLRGSNKLPLLYKTCTHRSQIGHTTQIQNCRELCCEISTIACLHFH